MDRISELPPIILHHILSRLHRSEAASTSMLSKHWNSIWYTFPTLDFTEILSNSEQIRDFAATVDKSLHTLVRGNLSVHTLHLRVYYPFDHRPDFFSSLILPWLSLALRNGVSDLKIDVEDDCLDESRQHHILSSFHVLPENTIFGSCEFRSLQRLSLCCVSVSESVMGEIFRNCPNLKRIVLSSFYGLQNLDISGLPNLEEVIVASTPSRLDRVRLHDLPNLKEFLYHNIYHSTTCNVSLTSCPVLKKLSLSDCGIDDATFHSNLSGFPELEDLKISECLALRRLRITAPHLRALTFYECNNIEWIEINAPQLSSLEYTPGKSRTPALILKNDVVSSPIGVARPCGKLGTPWFLKLRELLAVASPRRSLSLYLGEYWVHAMKIKFDDQELQRAVVPPPVKLDDLKLVLFRVDELTTQRKTLMNGLLLSCHPNTISIESTSRCSVEDFCTWLFDTQPEPSNNSCWRRDLKSVKIENSSEIGWRDWLKRALPLQGNFNCVLLRFQLDWNF